MTPFKYQKKDFFVSSETHESKHKDRNPRQKESMHDSPNLKHFDKK